VRKTPYTLENGGMRESRFGYKKHTEEINLKRALGEGTMVKLYSIFLFFFLFVFLSDIVSPSLVTSSLPFLNNLFYVAFLTIAVS
jgi:hypothetical protein